MQRARQTGATGCVTLKGAADRLRRMHIILCGGGNRGNLKLMPRLRIATGEEETKQKQSSYLLTIAETDQLLKRQLSRAASKCNG
jgi:hypothetical protein